MEFYFKINVHQIKNDDVYGYSILKEYNIQTVNDLFASTSRILAIESTCFVFVLFFKFIY
jgi:hypothetical protein